MLRSLNSHPATKREFFSTLLRNSGATDITPILDILEKANLSVSTQHYIPVSTERDSSERSFLDLVVWCYQKPILIIENKVDSVDDPEQLLKYQKWQSQEYSHKRQSHALVILTKHILNSDTDTENKFLKSDFPSSPGFIRASCRWRDIQRWILSSEYSDPVLESKATQISDFMLEQGIVSMSININELNGIAKVIQDNSLTKVQAILSSIWGDVEAAINKNGLSRYGRGGDWVQFNEGLIGNWSYVARKDVSFGGNWWLVWGYYFGTDNAGVFSGHSPAVNKEVSYFMSVANGDRKQVKTAVEKWKPAQNDGKSWSTCSESRYAFVMTEKVSNEEDLGKWVLENVDSALNIIRNVGQ